MEKEIDQVIDGIVGDEEFENNEQSNEQSEETKEEPITLEDITALVRGLQKGYTVNAQAIAELRNNLQPIVDKINRQDEAESGEDEYLTVGKLKQILQEQSQQQITQQQQSESYINNTLSQLRAEGVIKTKEDENALMQYAVDKKEPDLLKAADRWLEVKKAKEEAKKDVAKTKTQQEEGSKIGTSSKTSTSEQGGVDYGKVKRMDWF